ncbi:MAG: hypothetical protein WCH35_13550 [Comamonadaceae bacterium]
MNTPEMTELELTADKVENESIRLMREQSSALLQRKQNTRVVWWHLIASTFIGILLLAIAGTIWSNRIESRYMENVTRYINTKSVDSKSVKKEVMQAIEDPTTSSEVKKLLRDEEYNYERKDDLISNLMGFSIFLGFFIFPVAHFFGVSFYRSVLEKERYRIEYKIIQTKAQQLQDNIGQDFFTTLVRINFKYLDQYYFQTQEQANKSFLLSVYASIGGGLIIAVGILSMLFGKTANVSYVTTASGLVSQFIAAVFFYLYNQTVLKMGEYHQKLVLTQNIGIALKITESLPEEDRAKAQQLLVAQLTSDINAHLSGSAAFPASVVATPPRH